MAVMATATASYRFRIEVPDRPGALARVTDVLAEAGGNVESIDLHVPSDGVAVDEIGVEAPEDWDMVGVAARIDRIDGARVLVQRRERHPGDPVVNALRWARHLLVAAPAESELELARAILEVTGASVAWTTPVPEARVTAVGRAALERRAAVSDRADALPDGRETDVEGPYWLLAVPDDVEAPRLVAFVARPVATRFSPTESARLEALLRLRRALLTTA
jgi:predicted amino acid-binding ACT domain protein